jgi:hypothetical protein
MLAKSCTEEGDNCGGVGTVARRVSDTVDAPLPSSVTEAEAEEESPGEGDGERAAAEGVDGEERLGEGV